MTTRLLGTVVLLASMGLSGCDETSKQCLEAEDAPVKARVSACGELCEKKDSKACAKQVELANAACIEGDDAEVCRWMCEYATTGKDVYCKKHEELTGSP